MRLDDSYRLFDLDPAASDDEVKRAYRDLTKVWHPDRFGHDPQLRLRAEEKLKEIHEAYETIRASREGGAPDARDDDSPPGEEGGDGGWRVRWRGREIRVENVSAVAALVDLGTVGEGAEVFDPAAGCWAAAEWIPELREALARRRVRRYRNRALVAAAVAVFFLLRRPTPAGLVIALALLGLSFFFVTRMRSAGRAAPGPG